MLISPVVDDIVISPPLLFGYHLHYGHPDNLMPITWIASKSIVLSRPSTFSTIFEAAEMLPHYH